MNVTIMRFHHEHVAHNSYLLADPRTGTAAVVDPYVAVDPYLEAAHWMGARIRHIFLTEQHDDFPGGRQELRDRSGATVYAGAWTRPPFDFLPVKDGDILEFGQVRLQVLETPGHRLEAISILAYDLLCSASDPFAAFTGDTLLLGDAGLPEPRGEDAHSRSDLAGMLYDSLRQKLAPLPASMRIYPAHAETNPAGREGLTGSDNLMRAQRVHNPALQAMSRREFSIRMLAGTSWDLCPPEHKEAARLRPVTATELLRAAQGGAQVIDLRSPADFAAVHFERSLNVPLVAAFETWVDAIVDRDEPMILIAPPGQERAAASRLSAAGFGHVAGYLKGGMQGLEDRPQLLRGEHRYSLPSLEEALQEPNPPELVEIGRPEARSAAVTFRLEELRKETAQLSPDREIAVFSETPFRSSAAASFLRRHGFPRVRTLTGGLALWGRRPLDTPLSARKD